MEYNRHRHLAPCHKNNVGADEMTFLTNGLVMKEADIRKLAKKLWKHLQSNRHKCCEYISNKNKEGSIFTHLIDNFLTNTLLSRRPTQNASRSQRNNGCKGGKR